ncbi:MAG: glycosyltransferase family 9 protein [Candidatus Riflebacteria bacterium]|nr:glycosyltransferase family 9 protein [Candidatus Riflebacteria bacterium]
MATFNRKNSQIIIRLSALGDILLAVPVANKLIERDLHPVWVIGGKFSKIAPYLPGEFYVLNNGKNLLKIAKKLKSLKSEMVHELQGKLSSRFLAAIIGSPTSFFQKRSMTENLKAFFGLGPLRDSHPDPVWKRYLKAASLPFDDPDPSLKIPETLFKQGEHLFRELAGENSCQTVLLHPSASKPGKIFPPLALEKIAGKLDRPLALIGDKADSMVLKNCVDLRGRVPLELLPIILKLSAGLITTDSGPMHLARAVGTKFAAFFFQTDPSLGFSPIPGKNHLVFSRNLQCKPCSLHGQRIQCPEKTWDCRKLEWDKIANELSSFFGSIYGGT